MTNIGIHVIAAIADRIDCMNHNLDIEINVGNEPVGLLLVVVEAVVFMNDGSNCCCC